MIIPPHLARLPAPSLDAIALSDKLSVSIAQEIDAAGGFISFARYMKMALYAPGLGYYSAGSHKLGESGDFITAPEMSLLFAQCIARQLAQLHGEGLDSILEIGAGSGALAADLLQEMNALGCAPENYLILELSGDLRERQKATIAQRAPALINRVHWLEVLPTQFEGVILANEVLDATPAHRVCVTASGIEEMVVGLASPSHFNAALHEEGRAGYQRNPLAPLAGRGGFTEEMSEHLSSNENKDHSSSEQETICFSVQSRRATDALQDAATKLDLPPTYQTEINLTARALVTSLSRLLTRGLMLFIDYGFPARELYHPQRSSGTLMCHYRHHAHDDPFALVGLQDITTHVDFSAVAAAALQGGAEVLGYATQAQFLINCGITELLSATPASDARAYAPLAAQAQKLLSPAEMGELFKVIALGKNFDAPLLGYSRGDKSHTL